MQPGKVQGPAAKASPAQRQHIVDRFREGAPGIYIPTAEEAAAIERRNWITMGASFVLWLAYTLPGQAWQPASGQKGAGCYFIA